eukprot:m.309627 g.309627  ORF g.309627 m.309627 type:complete len:386 (+) comp23443_c0_seq1:1211-2368(+)
MEQGRQLEEQLCEWQRQVKDLQEARRHWKHTELDLKSSLQQETEAREQAELKLRESNKRIEALNASVEHLQHEISCCQTELKASSSVVSESQKARDNLAQQLVAIHSIEDQVMMELQQVTSKTDDDSYGKVSGPTHSPWGTRMQETISHVRKEFEELRAREHQLQEELANTKALVKAAQPVHAQLEEYVLIAQERQESIATMQIALDAAAAKIRSREVQITRMKKDHQRVTSAQKETRAHLESEILVLKNRCRDLSTLLAEASAGADTPKAAPKAGLPSFPSSAADNHHFPRPATKAAVRKTASKTKTRALRKRKRTTSPPRDPSCDSMQHLSSSQDAEVKELVDLTCSNNKLSRDSQQQLENTPSPSGLVEEISDAAASTPSPC